MAGATNAPPVFASAVPQSLEKPLIMLINQLEEVHVFVNAQNGGTKDVQREEEDLLGEFS